MKIFFDVHTAREEADILREVAILKGCRDRNVVQFYGACLEVRVLLRCYCCGQGRMPTAIEPHESAGALLHHPLLSCC